MESVFKQTRSDWKLIVRDATVVQRVARRRLWWSPMATLRSVTSETNPIWGWAGTGTVALIWPKRNPSPSFMRMMC